LAKALKFKQVAPDLKACLPGYLALQRLDVAPGEVCNGAAGRTDHVVMVAVWPSHEITVASVFPVDPADKIKVCKYFKRSVDCDQAYRRMIAVDARVYLARREVAPSRLDYVHHYLTLLSQLVAVAFKGTCDSVGHGITSVVENDFHLAYYGLLGMSMARLTGQASSC